MYNHLFSSTLPTSWAPDMDFGGEIKVFEALAWKVPLRLPVTSWVYLDDQAAKPSSLGTSKMIYKDSISKGIEAEEQFLEVASQNSWTPRRDVDMETMDRKHHVDACLRLGDVEMWVDVKARRALRRGAPGIDSSQSKYMVIELHSSGWLWGKADVIAQELQTGAFAMFSVKAIREFLKFALPPHTVALSAYPEQAEKRVYRRSTSLITYVSVEELYAVAGCGIWTMSESSEFVEEGEEDVE